MKDREKERIEIENEIEREREREREWIFPRVISFKEKKIKQKTST